MAVARRQAAATGGDFEVELAASMSKLAFILFDYDLLSRDRETHAERLAHWLVSSAPCDSAIASTIVSDENIQRAADLCSRDVMLSMVTKFDDHWLSDRQVDHACLSRCGIGVINVIFCIAATARKQLHLHDAPCRQSDRETTGFGSPSCH